MITRRRIKNSQQVGARLAKLEKSEASRARTLVIIRITIGVILALSLVLPCVFGACR